VGATWRGRSEETAALHCPRAITFIVNAGLGIKTEKEAKKIALLVFEEGVSPMLCVSGLPVSARDCGEPDAATGANRVYRLA
jgi:hypothetical protein